MRIILSILALSLFSTILLAAGHSGHVETDIIPRTVNFSIFAALVYYLLADKIKSFFASRSNGIAKSFSEVEEKIKASRLATETAKAKKDEAKKIGDELIIASNADAKHQAIRIVENAKLEAISIRKHAIEDMELLKRRTITEVVTNSLNEIISQDGLGVDDTELGEVLARKVA
jgi:F-type H+-transporting ATPase subunit b